MRILNYAKRRRGRMQSSSSFVLNWPLEFEQDMHLFVMEVIWSIHVHQLMQANKYLSRYIEYNCSSIWYTCMHVNNHSHLLLSTYVILYIFFSLFDQFPNLNLHEFLPFLHNRSYLNQNPRMFSNIYVSYILYWKSLSPIN